MKTMDVPRGWAGPGWLRVLFTEWKRRTHGSVHAPRPPTPDGDAPQGCWTDLQTGHCWCWGVRFPGQNLRFHPVWASFPRTQWALGRWVSGLPVLSKWTWWSLDAGPLWCVWKQPSLSPPSPPTPGPQLGLARRLPNARSSGPAAWLQSDRNHARKRLCKRAGRPAGRTASAHPHE